MSDTNLTKKALINSLKELCRHKNFDKITVTDITKNSGLNRQTFYYHFRDKYDALNWIYENETFSRIEGTINLMNWSQRLKIMFKTMKEDKDFYMNTICHQKNNFAKTLYNATSKIFLANIKSLNPGKNIEEARLNFYISFLAHGCCGIIMDWIQNNMSPDPEELTADLLALEKDIQYLIIEGRNK